MQYQHDGRDLVSTPVLFMSLDPISLLRINTDEETFEAEFYLSIRTEDRDIGIADIEFTNAFRSSTSQQPLISWREINDGSRVTRFPSGTRIYKVSGKFGFEAQLQNYPFDSQRLSISFQPVSASRPFIIQPVDPAATGARAEIDGWDIEENYVGTDQDVIPTLDVRHGAKTIVTFYKFNQTFMVKRQAVDFYLRVLIPLIFILLVSWFSVFLATDRFDSIMAIQVTALLSAIAFYLALPQVDSGEATLSDRTFVATYAAVSLMIGLSVLQDRLTPRWPLIGRLVFGVQAIIFPLLLDRRVRLAAGVWPVEPPRSSIGAGEAAVDDDDLPGDVAAVVASEKDDRSGNLLRLAGTPQRQPSVPQVDVAEPIALVLVLAVRLDRHAGVDETGRHRIDADAGGSEVDCQRAGEADQRRLGRRVGECVGLPAEPLRRGDVDDCRQRCCRAVAGGPPGCNVAHPRN